MKSRRKRPLAYFSWLSCWRITLVFIAQFTGVLIQSAQSTNSQKVPSAPKNVDLTQINASSVKVSWEPPEHGGETAEIMGYYVYKDLHVNGKNTNNVRKAVVIVDHKKHYAFINDLEPNSEYAIRVAAFNQYGDGEHSFSKRIVTGGRPPSAPRPQSIRPIKEEKPVQATVEWLPPKHTYGLPILQYLIWYKPVELNFFEKAQVKPSDMSYTLTNLQNGQEYELHIAAVNEIGMSENATEHFFTGAGLPDGEPLNIRYTIFKNHLTILWDPPLWLHRNGNITHYKVVFKSVQGRNSGQIIEKNVTSQSIVFEVDSMTSYTFKVAAATVKGQGPYSAVLSINSNASTSIGPPKNVRVQALTNSSVVVQWDFDEVANDGFADGFVVKYMHEPSGSSAGTDHYRATAGSGQDNWRTQTVMDSKARHLEITRLAQKPYAFCVLAIKHSRLGPCSDPPITLEKLKPTFVVQDLHVQYKTSQSVALHWEYSGPSASIGFYIKQMGMKTYQDQYLEEKTLVSPGFEKKIDGTERYFLWQNLRPYMNHTFQIGVYSLDDGRLYWPRELSVQTDPTGPPFVDTPEFIQSPSPTTAYLRLSCASEEYGPINHYWLIVVPVNYTKEDVVNVDSGQLQRSTSKHRAIVMKNDNNTYSGIEKRHNSKLGSKRAISLRQISPRLLDGVYITAQISNHQMQRYYRDERTFTLGDGKEYEGYLNVPLDANIKYQLMTRAFTRDDSWRRSSDHPFEFRPPMQEPASRLFTDSMLSAPFSTRSSMLTSSTMGRASNIWLVGPAIAIFVILVIVGMLVVWWLRCSRKSFRGLKTHHGSVTKVVLGVANPNGEFNSNGGVPNETSKLLLGMDADGRPVMNAYERPAMNDNHVMNMYTDSNLSHTNTCLNNNSGPAQQNNGGFATIGNIHSQHQLSSNNIMLNSSNLTGTQPSPIPLTQFATHIDRLKMNNNALFIQEYESIETGQHFTWENSMLDVNKHKNRYANVVAYDHSRVILSSLSGDPNNGSDYINANYIDGYEKPRAYIATQGPLPETFADFWRMVWEERCGIIVMLTRLEERSRTKCDQYWPTRASSVYGNFRVTLQDTTELAHYCIRVMRLEDLRTKEHREIQHAQFTAWPDHGVPNHPTPFLMFLKRVKSLNPLDAGPILTHCSAGIGRTGAFIVIDCMLDRLRYELTIDIYGCVKAIRAQRSYMVQTDDQYIFIHDAVLDAAQSGSTEVPSSKLAQHVQVLSHPQRQMDDATGMEIEFGTLVTLKCPNSNCMAANLIFNTKKNRTSNTLPYDSNRVELPFHPELEGSDYINASWIDGYRTRNAYIAAQAPLLNTVNDFWRMIWNEECCLIAMLTKLSERGQEKCCEYWPNETRENYNGLIVDCVSEFDMTHYMLREFKITEKETGNSRTVRQFQFMEWPDRGVPKTADRFVDYVRQVHQTKTQFGSKGPICVHCSEGAGRTGVFIAVSTIIERIMHEHVVDIFTAVKLLRMQRQNMVESKEQYEFCYVAAIEFLNFYEDA